MTGSEKSKYSGKNLPQCHFVPDKSQKNCSRVELRSEYWKPGHYCQNYGTVQRINQNITKNSQYFINLIDLDTIKVNKWTDHVRGHVYKVYCIFHPLNLFESFHRPTIWEIPLRNRTYLQHVRLTSPIMTAWAGSISPRALWKNADDGLPTTSLRQSEAYSRPLTNGPGPRASPSERL